MVTIERYCHNCIRRFDSVFLWTVEQENAVNITAVRGCIKSVFVFLISFSSSPLGVEDCLYCWICLKIISERIFLEACAFFFFWLGSLLLAKFQCHGWNSLIPGTSHSNIQKVHVAWLYTPVLLTASTGLLIFLFLTQKRHMHIKCIRSTLFSYFKVL